MSLKEPGSTVAEASFSVCRRRRSCDLRAAVGAGRIPRPCPVPGVGEAHDNTQQLWRGQGAGQMVAPDKSQVRRVGDTRCLRHRGLWEVGEGGAGHREWGPQSRTGRWRGLP